MIISFLNQKGGSGKSTLARTVAVAFINNKWDVHVADMDKSQRTITNWAEQRKDNGISPSVTVGGYTDAKTALKTEAICDLLVVDGAAYADTHTLDVSKASNLVVIPTGVARDDLQPSLNLAQELIMKGVSKDSILFVVMKVPENGDKEAAATRESIDQWGFKVAEGWVSLKTSYSKALDEGRTLTETRHNTLNKKADQVIQSIVDHFSQTQEENQIAS